MPAYDPVRDAISSPSSSSSPANPAHVWHSPPQHVQYFDPPQPVAARPQVPARRSSNLSMLLNDVHDVPPRPLKRQRKAPSQPLTNVPEDQDEQVYSSSPFSPSAQLPGLSHPHPDHARLPAPSSSVYRQQPTNSPSPQFAAAQLPPRPHHIRIDTSATPYARPMSSSSASEYSDGNIFGSPAPSLRALPSPQQLLEESPRHPHHRLSSLSLSPQHSYPPGDRPVLPPLQPSPILSRRQSLSPIVQHPLPLPRAISSSPTLSTLPRPQPPPPPSSSYSIQQQVMPPPAAVPFQPPRSRMPYAPRVRQSPPGSVLKPLRPGELEEMRASHTNRLRTGPPVATSSSSVSDIKTASASPRDVPHTSIPQVQAQAQAQAQAGYEAPAAERRSRMRVEDLTAPSKEKRPRESQADAGRAAKRSRDTELVAGHYNARPEVGLKKRVESPIIGLKSFNNWIKSVLIAKFAVPAMRQHEPPLPQGRNANGGNAGRPPRVPMAGKVLDMGCGKGGDLQKWSKANTKEYIGVDIADMSVRQAHDRWQTMRGGSRFDAEFAALDCYNYSLTTKLHHRLGTPFDVVSMQFCMHYAFESIGKVRMMLENVSKYLRPGGIFIGTVPNADLLLGRLRSLAPDAEPLEFGNSVYNIRFDSRDESAVYGQRYWFYLQDAVEDVPEYVVHWPAFEELARQYGLHRVYKEEFQEIYRQENGHPEYGPLLEKMRVVDAEGASSMDNDQWEAANIYIGFAFQKR